MVTVLAFSLQDQVEKYGAYVGLAAFLGLAVLTLLYFAQAREVKRLREWAGRAPERALEMEARVVAQAEEARRAAAAAPRTVGPAQPAARPPAPAASPNGRGAGAPAPVPMGPRPATAAATAAGPVAAVPVVAWPGGTAPASEDEPATAPEPSSGDGAAIAGSVPPETSSGDGAAIAGGAPPDAETSSGDGAAVAGGAPPASDEPTGDAAESGGDGAAVAGGDQAAGDESPVADAPAGDEPPAPAEPARPGNGVPAEPPRAGEIPPAPIPRATPRPAPAPRRVPAAPLRAPAPRSATLPPRRGAPPRAGEGSNAGRIALIAVLGAIVLGGGAFAAVQLFDGGEEPTPAPNRATEPGGGPASSVGVSERALAARPETVVVVLNGTPIEGLASDKRDELLAQGYSDEEGMIRTGNATDQQRQDTAILFPSGQRRQARDVASIFGVDSVELIDPDTQRLADLTDTTGDDLTAEVVVVLGADQAP
jgi:LytR cell envelope-related transcriptional attenuator